MGEFAARKLIHSETININDCFLLSMPRKGAYFYLQRLDKNSDLPPKLYKIVAKYQEYYHGFKRLFGKYGITQYLIEPVEGKTDRRLFMSVPKRRKCKEKTDLIDPDTGKKIDFVCD